MKNVVLIFAMVLSVTAVVAQQSNKNKYEIDVTDDVKLIEATLFHDNGEIAQTGYYTLDNKLQGEWISYDVDNNITAIAKYEDGKKVGTWKFFQGKAIKEVKYQDSRIAAVNTWEVTETKVVSNRP